MILCTSNGQCQWLFSVYANFKWRAISTLLCFSCSSLCFSFLQPHSIKVLPCELKTKYRIDAEPFEFFPFSCTYACASPCRVCLQIERVEFDGTRFSVSVFSFRYAVCHTRFVMHFFFLGKIVCVCMFFGVAVSSLFWCSNTVRASCDQRFDDAIALSSIFADHLI